MKISKSINCKKAAAAAAAILCCLLISVSADAYPSSGVPVSANIVVRDDANGNAIVNLPEGEEVEITGEKTGSDGYTWYSIIFNYNGVSTEGWVRSDLLDTSGASEVYEDEDTDEEDADDEDSSSNETSSDGDEASSDAEFSFVIDDKTYLISEDFSEEDLPSGAQITGMYYQGVEISAAVIEDAQLYMLYLVNEDDSSDAGFYVYYDQTDYVSALITIETGEGNVYLINIPEDMLLTVSSDYEQTECVFPEDTITALITSQTAGYISSDVSGEDFYFVYGVLESGDEGWYIYDSSQDTLQRCLIDLSYDEEGTGEEDAADEEDAGSYSYSAMLLCGLAAICVLLLILCVIQSVRCRRLKKDDYDDEDEEDDDDDEEETLSEDKKGRKKRGRGKKKDEEYISPDDEPEDPSSEGESSKASSGKEQSEAAGKEAVGDTATHEAAGADKTVEVSTRGGRVDILDLDNMDLEPLVDEPDFYDEEAEFIDD